MVKTLPGRAWRRLRRIVRPPKVVLGRFACLGRDVLAARAGPDTVDVRNQQKVRCDLFLDWLAGAPRPRADAVAPHLRRTDILPLIREQEALPWLSQRGPVAYLLMDSFAELTDQQFVHRREGWSFASHYSDLEHTPAFKDAFECVGLMPVERFHDAYRQVFDWYAAKHAHKPLIFLHFPPTLDERPAFRDRAAAILDVVDRLAKDRPWLTSIAVDAADVVPDDAGDFPYHYGPATYDAFARAWPPR